MKISEHFRRSEFACKCGCCFDTVDAVLLQALEDIRNHFNAPVRINSGCRCTDYNLSVGGSWNSQHKFGKASDFEVEGVIPNTVQEYVEWKYPYRNGIGRYDTFTHIDVRDGHARWDERTQ